ncbi:MAG TPA: GAF domain-containing sensor histidine kinase [Gemmatimonadaceae bacterium]|nr:GAF domain-containing sensor histidine kinase [Gemmatimonadaceae bacterium]
MSSLSELNAALLQAVITMGIAGLCAFLFVQFRKRYFLWWAIAWGLYVLRIGAICGFLTTASEPWLYVHQVLTGWTALALLGAALTFAQQIEWRRPYIALVLFPPLWSYVAIYRLDNFLLAAGPAVLFLSIATLWTGWAFWRYQRRTGSRAAGVVAGVLVLWGLHHLDYPLLRARGAWNPWGYYLDIGFVLALGAGILLLVVEDLRRGLATLSALSGDLQLASISSPDDGGPDVIDSLLARPLALGGVRGSALCLTSASGSNGSSTSTDVFVRGVGACAEWSGNTAEGTSWEAMNRAARSGAPEVVHDWRDPFTRTNRTFAYVAVLPVIRDAGHVGALVIVGDEGDPFTALGDEFLSTLGRQVGAALENADLTTRLAARTRQLERLSVRMVRQHEEERRRISLELHDETAQAFAAVKLQLGVLRESVEPVLAPRMDRVLELVDTGMRSIRNVTRDLRPPLLDELGLLPALRALVEGFGERTGITMALTAPDSLPPLSKDAELALFRALQEALSNVARHAGAQSVRVALTHGNASLALEVLDDGRGLSGQPGLGLTGMQERLGALGGGVRIANGPDGGARLTARLPVEQVAG